MSATQSNSDDSPIDESAVVRHSIDHLLEKQGGAVPVVEAAMQIDAATSLSAERAEDIIDAQEGTEFEVEVKSWGKVITEVSTIKEPPQEVLDAFDIDHHTISALPDVTPAIETALENAGYDDLHDIAEADPIYLVEELNDELFDLHPDPEGIDTIPPLTDPHIDDLKRAGITTWIELARTPSGELVNYSKTLTEGRVKQAQEFAKQNTILLETAFGEEIIEAAQQMQPAVPRIASEAVDRHQVRKDEYGHAEAIVRSVEDSTDSGGVGAPLATVRDDLAPDDPEAQYVSDLGPNEGDPVPTGLQVLEDTDYDLIPRLETDSRAGDDALPVDENGEVVPPAVPTAEYLQRPVDELVGKKLARGAVPVRLVGPPGSGKNYLLKYIAYERNWGYRSVDVGKSTMPKDLFGPLTPNEDGVVVSRNGPVKQGLLNGDLVVINEFPAMPNGAKMELHRYLNEGKLLIKSHGELIEPHPAARLVVTMNPPTPQNRGSEPMPKATRERFRSFRVPYPQNVDAEVNSLDQQYNTPDPIVDEDTLTKIVEFAHRTRKDRNSSWPTLSTRSLTVVLEHIEDGASPQAALKNVLDMIAERSERPEDAFEPLGELFE